MSKLQTMLDDAINCWKANIFEGTFIMPPNIDTKPMILSILQRVYNKNPTYRVLIIVDDWDSRCKFVNYITESPCKENNEEFKALMKEKHLTILSRNGACSDKFNGKGYDLVVAHNLRYFPHKIAWIYGEAKYKLVILDKLLEFGVERTALYKTCPVIGNFSQQEYDELRTSTPIEEVLIDVRIDDEEQQKLLDYYNEYITTSLNIFGSFEIMQHARLGNDRFNISASTICYQIAEENGWRPDLDMSIALNVQIDELYNPINIKERAAKTYEMIRNRGELLANYKGKIDKILDVVNNNPDDKILIISKKASFAKEITDKINAYSSKIICGDYHDFVDPIPELDSRGKSVCYASGAKKGKIKYLGAQAQKTRNATSFRENRLRVLSTNNAPDKKLDADVSIVIITSPQCETMESYMYRLTNLCYPNNKIRLFTIYVKNSLEQKKLEHRTLKDTHTIVNNCEKVVVSENNSDFIVVD